jgi:hypothetical protein
MIQAYINRPNARITIHRTSDCPQIGKQQKEGQQRVVVTETSLGNVLSDFAEGHYVLTTDPPGNDLLLGVTLDSPEQELGVVHVVHALLGTRYRPLKNAVPNPHC